MQIFLAGATGFEPAVSALTGPHVKPLHHAPELHKQFNMSYFNRQVFVFLCVNSFRKSMIHYSDSKYIVQTDQTIKQFLFQHSLVNLKHELNSG